MQQMWRLYHNWSCALRADAEPLDGGIGGDNDGILAIDISRDTASRRHPLDFTSLQQGPFLHTSTSGNNHGYINGKF